LADHEAPSAGKLRGVVFDMDGVLVLSEPILAEAAVQMFKEKGYDVKTDEFRPFIGMGEDKFIGGVAEARKIPIDPKPDKARTYAIYLDRIEGRLRPITGAKEFVEKCRRRGLKTALASSADEIKVHANLREIGLPPGDFDAVVNGSEVARKKPAPDIFQEAIRRLGLEPAACLVVEDAIAGVEAARAAGARCLAVTTSFPADALKAHGAGWVGRDLADVPDAAIDW